MTNWHRDDPVLETAEGLAFTKLIHVVVGVYLWELVLNLDYEYSIITGKHKFKRSVPLCLGCRWCTLGAMIMYLTDLDLSTGINCQARETMMFIFGYFAFQSASCLIILRIYALWERKRMIVVVSAAILLANTTAYVYNIAIAHAHWNGTVCELDHVMDTRITLFSSFITDLLLLSLLLLGAWRWKADHMKGGIWGLMYTQGLIYAALATFSYVPNVTFLLLNLNDVMDQMFMVPSMAIMSISTLRMYRGLVERAAADQPLDGLICATRPSTIRFAHQNCREESTPNTGGTALDPWPTARSKRIGIKRHDDDTPHGSEVA